MTERTFVPDWPDLPAHIGVLSTLRGGGCSLAPHDDGTGLAGGFNLATHVGDDPMHVNQNRTVLAQLLPSAPRWLTQVHGTRVIDLGMPEINLNADACFSTQPGVVCAVQTADCLPVLICDGTKNVVAAAHAGWRGLVSGVLENTLEQMQIAGAEPQNITVWLGRQSDHCNLKWVQKSVSGFWKLIHVRAQHLKPVMSGRANTMQIFTC